MYQEKISNLFGPSIIIDVERNIELTNISIIVSKGLIKITVPFYLSNQKINELLKKKFTWIRKKILIQQKIQPSIKKLYTDGEKFKYLGGDYKLKIKKGKSYSVNITNNILVVIVNDTSNIIKIKKLIHKWLLNKSNLYFKEKTLFYAEENKLKVTSVKVREYKSRWGSCNINGGITFNWRLIMAPPEVIKYVIIHELVHLIEHNHSRRYWEQVKKLYPNIDEAKKWLIYNGKTLNI